MFHYSRFKTLRGTKTNKIQRQNGKKAWIHSCWGGREGRGKLCLTDSMKESGKILDTTEIAADRAVDLTAILYCCEIWITHPSRTESTSGTVPLNVTFILQDMKQQVAT